VSDKGRTPERQILAAAIEARNHSAEREATLVKAAERARADGFLARRSVEAAEAALRRAREGAPALAVDAYLDGAEVDAPSVADAERALAEAEKRAAELKAIEAELITRTGPAPGRTLPNIKVEAALRDVVRSHPTVRRMVKDFETARRTFQQYEATLIHLAGQACIPDDLTSTAPKAHHTRYAEPDPAWLAAFSALSRDADASLPE
jgi:hypothetical protein